ncbi:MAG: DUF885 domain-containing protein [Janthinobacterium lividum]
MRSRFAAPLCHTLAFTMFSTAFCGAQNAPATPQTASGVHSGKPAAKSTAADVRLRQIYTAEWKWRQRLGGDDEDETTPHIQPHLPKVGAPTQAEALAYWTKTLAQLETIDSGRLSAPERLNLAVYRAQIQVLVNAQHFREYERPVNSDSAFWSDEAGAPDQPFRSETDYVNCIARMRDIPRFFTEEEANMRAGVARGFTPPQVTLTGRDKSLSATADAKSPEETAYWKPFVKMPESIAPARQTALRAQAHEAIATAVIPAYQQLLRFWVDDYVPHTSPTLAATALPDGKAYYQSLILEYATTTQTPEEIHALGLSEMAKIHTEMLATMKEAGFAGDLPAFLHFLRTDPQFYAKTPDELLMRAAFIAKEFDDVAGRYFGYEPRGRFGIRPVPAAIAPFYTSARGGPSVYLVNTFDLPSRGLYSLPALTLHESAPGHSWQLSIAAEHKDLPKFRNAYISAYGEGWALYCERLGTEMGMYHTPYERFGMLSYQAWRAARLVVDTGIHAGGWTREQGQQYLRENTALSDHEIETEVDRYISWPAQALSYYLGELSIQKERARAEAALGPKFNLRAFHDAVLDTGAVPLPVLEEHLNRWIAGGGVGPYPEMER